MKRLFGTGATSLPPLQQGLLAFLNIDGNIMKHFNFLVVYVNIINQTFLMKQTLNFWSGYLIIKKTNL